MSFGGEKLWKGEEKKDENVMRKGGKTKDKKENWSKKVK
jgi:hypothetical protein